MLSHIARKIRDSSNGFILEEMAGFLKLSGVFLFCAGSAIIVHKAVVIWWWYLAGCLGYAFTGSVFSFFLTAYNTQERPYIVYYIIGWPVLLPICTFELLHRAFIRQLENKQHRLEEKIRADFEKKRNLDAEAARLDDLIEKLKNS